MKIPITRLKEGENVLQFHSIRDPWIVELVKHLAGRGYPTKGPFDVDLLLTKFEPEYYVRGKLDFKVEQTCGRCTEIFELPIHHTFDVAMAHVENTMVKGSLISDDSNELDINFFDGNEIDLAPVIEEQFFLSIPYQVVCKNECKGICQFCGKNLNEAVCDCANSKEGPHFSVLQQLKL